MRYNAKLNSDNLFYLCLSIANQVEKMRNPKKQVLPMLIITSLVLFTFNFLFAAFGWLAVPPGVEVNGDILRSLPKTSVVSQCDAGLVWHHFLRLSIWYKCGMLCI